MNGPFFVEVLGRNGEVRQRQRIDVLPIRIGRGYDNDCILDDREVAVHHAVVELATAGGLIVRDPGSGNGVTQQGQRHQQLMIDGNSTFRLGHTTLRVRSIDFSLADETLDTRRQRWEGWRPALTGVVMIALLMAWSNWTSDIEESASIRYFISIAAMLTVAVVWCGIWAFANHLFGGQTRFGRHIFIAACGLVAIEVSSLIMAATAYAFSLEIITRYGNHVSVLIAGVWLYFHLLTVNPGQRRRAMAICLVLSLLSSAITLMINYQGNGYLADELYMSELMSPSLRLSGNKPVAQFLGGAQRLKDRVDKERIKIITADGDDGDGQE